MKTIKVDCSSVLSHWLAELQPELEREAVDATLPISGFVEKIDLVIVGEKCEDPIELARSISGWAGAPLSVFVIDDEQFESVDQKLQYAPGIGKNILSCKFEKESFKQTMGTALEAIETRIRIGEEVDSGDTLINPNLSSKWLLNRLLKELPEYIYFKDTNCRFLAVSNHLAQKTGLKSGAEAIGKTDFALFDDNHAVDAEADERALIDGKLTHIDKEEFVTWQKNQIWVQTYKLPLMSPSGYALGTFGISRDITQKKRMQDEQMVRHKQLNEEMELARLLQKSLLNRELPAFVDTEGKALLEFATNHVPSTKLSGDFYRIVRTPSGKPAVFLADVMGHGARAAMITAMLYAALNEISHLADDTTAYMLEINNRLHGWLEDTGQLIFASGIYCILDVEKGLAHICQCGGSHVLAVQAGQSQYFTGKNSPINPALGLTPLDHFTEHQIEISPQDEFAFFTDGIIEATNSKGETFGIERMCRALEAKVSSAPAEKLDALHRDLQSFTKRKHEEDDICLVFAKVL